LVGRTSKGKILFASSRPFAVQYLKLARF
jgi:hypothetical protein